MAINGHQNESPASSSSFHLGHLLHAPVLVRRGSTYTGRSSCQPLIAVQSASIATDVVYPQSSPWCGEGLGSQPRSRACLYQLCPLILSSFYFFHFFLSIHSLGVVYMCCLRFFEFLYEFCGESLFSPFMNLYRWAVTSILGFVKISNDIVIFLQRSAEGSEK